MFHHASKAAAALAARSALAPQPSVFAIGGWTRISLARTFASVGDKLPSVNLYKGFPDVKKIDSE